MHHPAQVTDVRSNPNEQIAHAATVLRRSPIRREVFEAICRGKKKIKKASDVADVCCMKRIRVLQEAKILVNNGIVKQVKFDGETAYEKDDFYCQQKRKVLSLAIDRRKLERFPTSRNPRGISSESIPIRVPGALIRARQITVDDIGSFAKVRSIKGDGNTSGMPISEAQFKTGVKRILGEFGHFQDWGGERNDLLTTRARLFGRRRATAFAFKGPGRTGLLTPRHMGKNGDQVQRLFSSPAEVFIVQYWGQISEGVLEQMRDFARLKSIYDGSTIYFGTIDGQDTKRLLAAYPSFFRLL
jgi:hypothetical protein